MSTHIPVRFDEQKIGAIFEPYNQCHLPGVAVGIAVQGKPVYREGFGLASMELPVVLSPSIRMRIGSTSKHFAALAFLLLCEEGKATLDDPIGRYLPELHPASREVSMRQLLGHTSGLRDVFDITWQFCGTATQISSEELLALYRDIEDVNASPDVTWSYNNGGYLMLSLAMERMAARPFEDLMRERVFEPIGMYETMVRRFEAGFVSNSATLHMTSPAGGFERSPFFGTAFLGEGGIASTVDDMLRWLGHMDAPRVGRAESWNTLRTPLILANGVSTGYGLGLFRGRYRGAATLHHAGGGMGGTAQMLKVPAAGLDIIVMANRGDASPMLLVENILDACLPDLEPSPEPSRGPFITGIFCSPTTHRVIQLFARGGQQIAAVDGMEMPLVRDEAGVLRPRGLFEYARQSLTVQDNVAAPESVSFNDYGTVDRLIAATPVKNGDFGAIAGRYRSASTHVEASIAGPPEDPLLITVGRFGTKRYRLEPLARNIWRAQPTHTTLGGILVFDECAELFRFSCHRTWALPFLRID